MYIEIPNIAALQLFFGQMYLWHCISMFVYNKKDLTAYTASTKALERPFVFMPS